MLIHTRLIISTESERIQSLLDELDAKRKELDQLKEQLANAQEAKDSKIVNDVKKDITCS